MMAGLKGPPSKPRQLSHEDPEVNVGNFPTSRIDANSIEINFRRDPTIYDGQFSNNGWLQELPKPMTKMTWDNPVLIGPAMAAGWI